MPINVGLVEHEKPIFRSHKLKHSNFATICLAIMAMDGGGSFAWRSCASGLSKKRKRAQRRRGFRED